MGQVWLAEQTAPVRRQAALKLIRAGMRDGAMLLRLQSERQSLAIMDHPSTAKVFDAGTTPDGQPYFVMEYVSGVPITDYCDQKKLSIRGRLQLFVRVSEGVQQHAPDVHHASRSEARQRSRRRSRRQADAADRRVRTCETRHSFWLHDGTAMLAGTPLGIPVYMSRDQLRPGGRSAGWPIPSRSVSACLLSPSICPIAGAARRYKAARGPLCSRGSSALRKAGAAVDRGLSSRADMTAYSFPGNVRELKSEMSRLAALASPDLPCGPDLLNDRIRHRRHDKSARRRRTTTSVGSMSSQ